MGGGGHLVKPSLTENISHKMFTSLYISTGIKIQKLHSFT